MTLFIQFIVAIIILCPISAFIIVLLIGRKLRLNKYKAVGLAADITTGLLFISIPVALKGLWDIGIMMPMLIVVLIIAIMITYIDWRTRKEVEVKPLLKKIWRLYFLLFSMTYFIIWVVGLTHSVMIFMLID